MPGQLRQHGGGMVGLVGGVPVGVELARQERPLRGVGAGDQEGVLVLGRAALADDDREDRALHQTLRRELLDDARPLTSLLEAQAAVDDWVREYNTQRPHQALETKVPVVPADRFQPVPDEQRELLPIWLPGALASVSEPAVTSAIERAIDAGAAEVIAVSLAGRQVFAAEILRGREVTIRIEAATLLLFDPDTRELLRARPNPLTPEQALRLRGARPAGPLPRARTEPVTVQRRVSATGVICVCRQTVPLGRIRAGHTVSVHVAEHTLTIELDDKTRTARRTTNPVVVIKESRHHKHAFPGQPTSLYASADPKEHPQQI